MRSLSSFARLSLFAILVLSLAACATTSHDEGGDTSGSIAAPMMISDLDGEPYDIGAALDNGETVALVFWQVWCPSCRAEAPAIIEAANTYGDSIRFLGVVPGPDKVVNVAEVRQTAESWGLNYPTLRDRDLSLTNLLGVAGTPTIVVLDSSRTIRYQGHQPPTDWKAFAK